MFAPPPECKRQPERAARLRICGVAYSAANRAENLPHQSVDFTTGQ